MLNGNIFRLISVDDDDEWRMVLREAGRCDVNPTLIRLATHILGACFIRDNR